MKFASKNRFTVVLLSREIYAYSSVKVAMVSREDGSMSQCTVCSYPHLSSKCSDVKPGQNFEAEAITSRQRPRP